MTTLSLIAVSSRTATVLLAPEKARFYLPAAAAYSLRVKADRRVATGETKTAVIQLDDLMPATDYVLTTSLGEISFTTSDCAGQTDISAFGADCTASDNTKALQAAIDAVPAGGTLVIPRGRFATGPLFLHSAMTVYLAEGAELAALSDWQDWPVLPARDENGRVVGTWEGLPENSFASLVNAIGCSDLTLTGPGTLDGGGDRGDWWSWPKETRRGARRPRTVFLAHCTNVTLSGLRVRNSPSWTIHPFLCRNLTAAALHIWNPPDSPNTDGLNPESCEDVRLTGLHFSVGDDCIAVKAGKRDSAHEGDHLAPTRDISITHCLMERGHGAVVLGSEMSGDITDVTIRNCEFSGTDRGLRIKTRRGRGGRVARISMDDIIMRGVDTAISANAFYFCDADGTSDFVQSRSPAALGESTPEISDISVSNVVAENVRLAAVALLGLPEAPFSQIRIDNMQVSFDPDALSGVPLMACDVPACRHEGVLADFADVSGGISLLQKDASHAD